jgi:Putative zinc-finger
MLIHPDWQTEAPEYLAGLLPPDRAERLAQHVTTCAPCATELAELSRVWMLLDSVPREEPAAEAGALVRQFIREDLRQGELLAREARWSFSGQQLAWTAAGGLLFAVSSVEVLAHVADLTRFSAPALLICGSLWFALYLLTFALYFRGEPLAGSRMNSRLIACAVLLAVPLTLAEDYFFPVSTMLQQTLFLAPSSIALGGLGPEGAYLSLGALYALVPLLLVSFAIGKELWAEPLKHGLLCGGLFFLLILPTIYLQAGSLSVGVELSWAVGALLGSLLGACSGFGLRTHLTT